MPRVSASSAPDSVEIQRLRNVSNMTSGVQYRAEFEKMKGDSGNYASVATASPEMRQQMKNSQQQSQIK